MNKTGTGKHVDLMKDHPKCWTMPCSKTEVLDYLINNKGLSPDEAQQAWDDVPTTFYPEETRIEKRNARGLMRRAPKGACGAYTKREVLKWMRERWSATVVAATGYWNDYFDGVSAGCCPKVIFVPFPCIPRRISDASLLTYLPRISCVSPLSHSVL